MKNITALALLVITGTFAVNHSLSCQEQEIKKYRFSIGPQFGFASGQALEVVYPENTKAALLSELRWDMKPIYYMGVQFDIDRIEQKRPAFFSSLSFKAGIPDDSGVMEDRDWLSKENDALTHFSSHANSTTKFLWLDITAGVSFPVKTYFYIKPFLSGSWMCFSYAARDGYGKYAKVVPGNSQTYYPIENNPDWYLFSGVVIRYNQNWLLAATGFTIGAKLPPLFSFELSFQISPFSFCIDRDEHLNRHLTYIDYTGWGLFLEPAARFLFTAQRLEFSFEYAFRHIGNTKGETLLSDDGGDFYLLNGKAGAGLSIIESRTIIKIRF
jgi:outer membrane protease